MLPGQQLRNLREELGLTVRDVEAASMNIAEENGNPEYAISISRLSDIETKGNVPSIYKLYSLSVIYRRSYTDLLALYGIDLARAAADLSASIVPPNSHLASFAPAGALRVPLRLDPSFDIRSTTNLGRMVQAWGPVPFAMLETLAEKPYSYGFIGAEDFTMYPLILPGSFVQVDETKDKVEERVWRSEYERPIYFVEGREGFVCCWCSLRGDRLVLQSHPLSPVPPRIVKFPQEAEVVGQVVGVAMRLGEVSLADAARPKERPRLN